MSRWHHLRWDRCRLMDCKAHRAKRIALNIRNKMEFLTLCSMRYAIRYDLRLIYSAEYLSPKGKYSYEPEFHA
jgi:hypothetical protein